LRTEFTVVHQLRDFLPDNCDTITDVDKRARCIGLKGGDSCERFCARFDGPCVDVCEAEWPYPGSSFEEDQHRRQCCRARRIDHKRNIGGSTTLILHGRMEVPPQMLIDDDAYTPEAFSDYTGFNSRRNARLIAKHSRQIALIREA
jgi:hypothetical protein